jgi:hypothetical protein
MYCFVGGEGNPSGGAIYNLDSSVTLYESDSLFNYTGAIEGGIYYCDSCTLNIDGNEYNNIYSFSGSLVYALFAAKITIENSILNLLVSLTGGSLLFL